MSLLRANGLVVSFALLAWLLPEAQAGMITLPPETGVEPVRHLHRGRLCPHLCVQWFDGCNNCACGRDGRINVCTEYHCVWRRPARCITWGF